MEIYELHYFVAVAKEESIRKASERIRVSPASLSKAISKLEAELGVPLFSKSGRAIRLTENGLLLQHRASKILQLEESARAEISGQAHALKIILAGPEILLCQFGFQVSQVLEKRFQIQSLTFLTCDEDQAVELVSQGNAHLCLVTRDIPNLLTEKIIGEALFQVAVGSKHPLFSRARAKKAIPIQDLLKSSFASPSLPLLGKVGLKQSLDGWRDDVFPRRVEYLTSSLKLLEGTVREGRALAYLPDYFIQAQGLEVLKVTGCPYSCTQKVKWVARDPEELGWLKHLF